MKNRFDVRIPGAEDPKNVAAAAVNVKEIGEQDFDAEVVAAKVPVVLDFYGAESKACETLAPRYAAVAEKFAGRIRFLKILRVANAQLAAKLNVTTSPTVVFLNAGKEQGERLSGEDIKRTDLKARVEAMLGAAVAAQPT
jgi:thioredoxin-like negative regulator of GroEL